MVGEKSRKKIKLAVLVTLAVAALSGFRYPLNFHQPASHVDTTTNVTPPLLHFPRLKLDRRLAAAPPSLPRRKRNLEKIEARLGKARTAIKEAPNRDHEPDPDYLPIGPMYRNAKAFHRSYLEMEKQFKVYIYEEGDPPIFHTAPSHGVLGLEGIFINEMEQSHFRTRDPDKAQVYFLPFSIISIVHFVYVVNSHDWSRMQNTVADYINVIAQKYPYWNRSLGADHFMLACHDWGPKISFAVPNLYNSSIRALCNANTSERFNPYRDVSIPEVDLPRGTTDGLLGGPSPSHRPTLIFFAGGVHGYIRTVLFEYWENKDTEVQVRKYLPKGVKYYDMLRKSKYCICPSGYEVADARIFEALYTGCVPIIIKDHYVAPFSDVLNWKSFSVIIPVKDIPNLKKIVKNISPRQYIKMQARGLKVRKHFEVNFPPKRYDVFHMILHSIWLRRLNLQIRDNEVL
ncbi:putative glycosyltransferase At5g03795 isoform X2 [Apium graveolens]|uniref:putative glycosyltransferase At5g03795 isoform X2 n=1 Tax=Apium graveolens TaxID=4045 RepID=UPI003D791147